jgi:hypothetical protein
MRPSATYRDPLGRRAAAVLLASLGALAAGCIEAADPETPMCEQSSDCDQGRGEVCDEGVCWGGPPEDISFAAVLVPPESRPDLPLTAIPLLEISRDGTIGNLRFPESIVVRGRVLLACPAEEGDPGYDCGADRSVGATINIERAPAFPGGPPLSRTVAATPGVGPGADAFSFLLPRQSGVEYSITITPTDNAGGEDKSPGELAPPRQLIIAADQDQVVEWTLGDPADLKTIRGCIKKRLDGFAYAGMQATAFGRWHPLAPLSRASSRSVTDQEGCFALRVPIGMLDLFDLVVKPAPGAILPAVRLSGELVPDPIEPVDHWIEDLVMPDAPSPTTFQLPVEAPGSGGGQVRVPGAAVRFTTRFEPPKGDLRQLDITFTAEAVTSDLESSEPGVAVVELFPGSEQNRHYLVQVVPPPDAQFQSAFAVEMAVGIGGSAQLLQPITLSRRIALTGTAVARSGLPVSGASVEIRASTSVRLTAQELSFGAILDQLQFPIATTDDDGSFVIWVDRVLVGEAASYDLDIQPALSSGAPSWTFESIEIPGLGDSLDLGELVLPDASYARGQVRDRAGEPVVEAELHLYQLAPADFCMRVAGEAVDCVPPAHLRGIWASDGSGRIRIVLPDP